VRRHRLHRGGDRGANHALHTIALCRTRNDQRTRAYVHRRISEGLSKQEIPRCLKRYIVRDVYTALRADFATPPLDLVVLDLPPFGESGIRWV